MSSIVRSTLNLVDILLLRVNKLFSSLQDNHGVWSHNIVDLEKEFTNATEKERFAKNVRLWK